MNKGVTELYRCIKDTVYTNKTSDSFIVVEFFIGDLIPGDVYMKMPLSERKNFTYQDFVVTQ